MSLQSMAKIRQALEAVDKLHSEGETDGFTKLIEEKILQQLRLADAEDDKLDRRVRQLTRDV